MYKLSSRPPSHSRCDKRNPEDVHDMTKQPQFREASAAHPHARRRTVAGGLWTSGRGAVEPGAPLAEPRRGRRRGRSRSVDGDRDRGRHGRDQVITRLRRCRALRRRDERDARVRDGKVALGRRRNADDLAELGAVDAHRADGEAGRDPKVEQICVPQQPGGERRR